MLMKEMNKGVQILLERMRSNPDEFVPDIQGKYHPKWRNIILSVGMRTNGGKDYKDQLPFLSNEEIKALWDGMQQLQGELFTKRVMNTLLMDAEELSSSFGEPNDVSKNWGTSTITLLNTNAVSTTTGKLRYP
jgi:RNA processing factor Prp31